MKLTIQVTGKTLHLALLLAGVLVALSCGAILHLNSLTSKPNTLLATQKTKDLSPSGTTSEIIKAAHALPQMLAERPDDPPAIIALADLKLTLKDYSGAVELYRSITTDYSDYSEVALKLASALTFLGEQKEALKILHDAAQGNEPNFKTFAYLAITLQSLGQHQKAKEMLRKAIQHAPTPKMKEQLRVYYSKLPDSQIQNGT